MRGSRALSHRGRTIDGGPGRRAHRDGRHGGSDAWPRRLCYDAQQSHALVYLQIKEYLSDVRDVRPHVRHRVGKTSEVRLITVRHALAGVAATRDEAL